MRKIFYIACIFLICGCTTFEQKVAALAPTVSDEDFGVPPENFQEQIENLIKEELLLDPDSAKFKDFTKPRKCFIANNNYQSDNPLPAWCSTLRVNAKNRMGGYVGFSTYLGIFMKPDQLLATENIWKIRYKYVD